MHIFKVRFQYGEQGMGGFAVKFKAWDADDAMRLGHLYADWARAHGVGSYSAVGAETAFSMGERDLDAMDLLRRLAVI